MPRPESLQRGISLNALCSAKKYFANALTDLKFNANLVESVYDILVRLRDIKKRSLYM